MVNVTLIVLPVIFGILVVIAAIYFLVYFQHPDDKWVAWLPKIVVTSISFTIYDVLLLPLDVANQGGQFVAEGGLPMTQITEAFFFITILLAIAVIPFTMFYYEGVDESDDEKPDVAKQVFFAAKWTFATLVVFFTTTAVLWATEGYADIYTDVLGAQLTLGTPADIFDPTLGTDFCPKGECVDNGVQAVQDPPPKVGFLMYAIAIASLAGWVLFSVFGGVGLATLPFDLLMEYKYRPKPIKLPEYTEKKRIIGEQAALLLQASSALTQEKKAVGMSRRGFGSSKGRSLIRMENEFKRDVLFLESQWKKLEYAYRNGGGNAIFYFFKMIVGFVGSFLSFFWLLHILLFVLPVTVNTENPAPLSPFLNYFFESINFPVIGITFYGMFVFWLMACVIKGVTKMGVRFLFITIHPMKIGETMMSSMLFNVGVMLLCSLAVTQFCTLSFWYYARYTASYTIFGNQLNNLRGLKYIYSILIWVLPFMTFFSFIYSWVRPSDYKLPKVI